MAAALAELDFIRPTRYQLDGYPHEEWTRMRREAPVYWFDRSRGENFWAITKHEDIVSISKRPDLFISEPRIVVQTAPLSERRDDFEKNLIRFDPPKHGPQRKLISKATSAHPHPGVGLGPIGPAHPKDKSARRSTRGPGGRPRPAKGRGFQLRRDSRPLDVTSSPAHLALKDLCEALFSESAGMPLAQQYGRCHGNSEGE